MPLHNQHQPGKTCYGCGGRGKIDTIGEETCSSCIGMGRDKTSDLWADVAMVKDGCHMLEKRNVEFVMAVDVHRINDFKIQ